VDKILLLKLLLTPVFIGLVSGFARRFGPRAGGWLAGLPLTSGPISVFVALEQGTDFAARAAPATILGIFPVAAFCLVWSRSAGRGLAVSYALAIGAYLVIVPLVARVRPEPWLALGLTLTALLVALLASPRPAPLAASVPSPRWDVPIRMVVATGLVLLITGLAHVLGPQWTGLLSPFPVFASVLAGFHHRHEGPDAATAVLRGILTGVLSFCAFFFVVAITLPIFGMLAAYGLASGCAILVNGVNGVLLRRSLPLVDAES
jgi:hypothetical protein